MLKELCFIKTAIFLFVLSVSCSEDYKLLRDVIFDENNHASSFNKHLNIFLQPTNSNHNDSIEYDAKQKKYDEILEKLRKVLTCILSNPDYIHYLTNFNMPVYNVDVRPAEDFGPKNVSLILRSIANSKKNDKKASDSSESSESNENDKNDLRYESCERGRRKCVKACKSSYREACYLEYCSHSLRRNLRKMCKIACRKWFI